MNRLTLTFAALTAIVFNAAGSSRADTVQLDFNGGTNPNPANSVKIKLNDGSGYTYSGKAGVMNFTVISKTDTAPLGNNPFIVGTQVQTFCIDAKHPLVDPDNYTVQYTPFSDNNATLLTKLFAAHFNDIFTGTSTDRNNKAAAFQMDIWEIIYDAPNTGAYSPTTSDFGSGIFKDNGTTSAILNQAKAWLTDFQTVSTTQSYTVFELDAGYSGQSQLYADLNTVTNIPTVPLPAALPAGLSLLATAALIGKLRRRS